MMAKDHFAVSSKAIGVTVLARGLRNILPGLLPALLAAATPLATARADRAPPSQTPLPPAVRAGEGDLREVSRYVAGLFVRQGRTWRRLLARRGRDFVPPRLRFFVNEPDSDCGDEDEGGSSFFYCPEDGHIYLNLLELRDLAHARGFDGRLLIGQILAHETGHHVQYQLGLDSKLGGLLSIFDSRRKEREKSHKFELQAECLSGVWARHDGGALTPEHFGTALRWAVRSGFLPYEEELSGELEVRLYWFRRGYDSGDIASCDTFRE